MCGCGRPGGGGGVAGARGGGVVGLGRGAAAGRGSGRRATARGAAPPPPGAILPAVHRAHAALRQPPRAGHHR